MDSNIEVEPDETLDVTGETCPFPQVRTEVALAALEVGQVLRVIGDYRPSLGNIVHDLKSGGHEILGARLVGEVGWEIVARKQ